MKKKPNTKPVISLQGLEDVQIGSKEFLTRDSSTVFKDIKDAIQTGFSIPTEV